MKRFFILCATLLFIFKLNAQLTDLIKYNISAPFDMVLVGEDLYFSEVGTGKISKINIHSTSYLDKIEVVGGIKKPTGLAIKGNNLYVAEFEGDNAVPDDGRILKIDITEANPVLETVVSGLELPNALLVIGDYLYFTLHIEEGKVMRIDLTNDNASPEDVVGGLKWPNGLLLDNNELYIVESGGDKISKIDITKTIPILTDVVTGVDNPSARPVLIENELYFSMYSTNKIKKINITQSNPEPELMLEGDLKGPAGLLYYNGILYICRSRHGISMYDFNILGVSDFELEGHISVYPNPVTDYLQFDTFLESRSKVTIFSITGQIIKKSWLLNNKKLDVRDLNSGVYLVKLDNFKAFKFIKK